jgi:hypothetical protein
MVLKCYPPMSWVESDMLESEHEDLDLVFQLTNNNETAKEFFNSELMFWLMANCDTTLIVKDT